MELTAKQKRFCQEYIIDMNATQAAIRAGYSRKTANRIGYENLSKLDIGNYIERLKEEKESSLIASSDEVLQRLTDILRGTAKEQIVIGETFAEKAAGLKDQLKAADLLGKYHGLFKERVVNEFGSGGDFELEIKYNATDDSP